MGSGISLRNPLHLLLLILFLQAFCSEGLADYYDYIFPSSAIITASASIDDFPIFNNDSNGNFMVGLSFTDKLYGRQLGINTNHTGSMVFGLFFITAAGQLTSDDPLFYLSLVAYDNRKNKPYSGQVIWTANPQSPVHENAWLTLTLDGDLQLKDADSSLVWQTHTASQGASSLEITYEGNLVLFNNNSLPVWQSFDHPTNTLMVLQVLKTGNKLFNWDVQSNNSTGNYTMVMEPGGLAFYATLGSDANKPLPYWVWSFSKEGNYDSISSVSNQTLYTALCWDASGTLSLGLRSDASNISAFDQVSPSVCSAADPLHTMTILDPKQKKMNVTYATFIRLEADGDLRVYTVNDTSWSSDATWFPFYTLFENRSCSLPMHCGFYGFCDEVNQTCSTGCSGLASLEAINASDPQRGCHLHDGSEPPTCSATGKAKLSSSIAGAAYFSNSFLSPDRTNVSSGDCQSLCLNNCSCTAAFFRETTSSCFLITDLVGSFQVNASNTGNVGFLKIIEAEEGPSRTAIIVGSAMAVLAVLMVVLGFAVFCFRRRKTTDDELENQMLETSLVGTKPERFTWKQLQEYTRGFSDPLGSGGFGTVFRGALPDGTELAVKQLTDGSHQGNKEFISEVSILSRIHHMNLVRLLGFCLEGAHKLLVYEYMENGSLDAWLFGNAKEEVKAEGVLRWPTRFDIAVGTARGLAYLHEECNERVIHMDLKPQNILVGYNFCPKISDFGMSRRMAREQSVVMMTTMRGTPGYLAPEWLMDCAVTEKSDVYSFGIVLLEIVCGRKVKDVRDVKLKLLMRSARDGVMGLLDEKLHWGGVNEEEAQRMAEVAMLCVQREPQQRPAMTSVVKMLEGEMGIPQSGLLEEEQLLFPSSMNRKMKMERELEMLSLSEATSGSHNFWCSTSSSSKTSTFSGYRYRPVSQKSFS